ncbi:hypothetical protein SprV_0902741200 [Sparganum proliferum]
MSPRPSALPTINTNCIPEPPLPSSFSASTSAATAPESIANALDPYTQTNTNLTTSDVHSVQACPHCDCTFNSRDSLVGHLRIYRTQNDEPVHTRRIRLHCPHCPSTFTHRMHMNIHGSGIRRSLETRNTSSTPTMPGSTHTPLPTTGSSNTATISETDPDTIDLCCPHSPRTFISYIGLVGHLRIHSTENGEPVSGAPTYTHRTRLTALTEPTNSPTI